MVTRIPMTTATGLGPLPDLLEAAGGSRAVGRAFDAVGLSLAVIEDRSLRFPLPVMVNLFDQAARLAGDARFGLEVGQAMAPGDYGLWARYAMQAPTLSGALARFTRCMVMHQVGGALLVIPRSPDRVVWEYRHCVPRGSSALQHNDHVLAVMIRVVRAYCGPDWTPLWIESAAPDPGDTSRREEATAAAWRFERGSGVGIALPTAALAARRRGAAPLGAPLSSAEVAAEIRERTSEGAGARISAIVALRLLDQETDIDGAARMAGLGRRSLQRLLEAEGTTYRALLERVRMERARALVIETELPLSHIGHTLGYSDQAHFTRAFCRHFGAAPSRMRLGPLVDPASVG
jgi:AraC-like DNA-binding protein